MCREALVGYLTSPRPSGGEGSGVRGLPEAKARALVYEHQKDDLTEIEGDRVSKALKAIKVVDPACGSGAYLLGMLQELYALFNLMNLRFGELDSNQQHERKLWIIENNLYGVDLQAFATNTAMLRLWLTLLVEDTGLTPQPLPNLEYKIETGDSLLGPDPSQPIDWSKVQRGLDFEGLDETVDALRKLRAAYQDSHGPAKAEVKSTFEANLADLREKVTGTREKDPAKFDWRVEFFDVFLEDPKQRQPGFDAVLANPPYVRQELIKDQKPALKAAFGEFFSGTADLYTFFYARAVHLLKPGGMLAFISSNKWFRAAYGEKLREFMASQTAIRSITDFGELPVFSAATFPMIFVAQKIVVSPSRRSRDENVVSPSRRSEHRPEAETTLVKRQGYFLPHWTLEGAIYHVIFRLRDSLPREVLERFEEEKRQLQLQAVGDRLSKEEAKRLNYLVSDRVEQYLDAGHGECLMKNPRIADLVQGALTHFEGQRYHLHAWAVMPDRKSVG